MKVDGSTAEVSQKIDREGAGLRFCFIRNGGTGGFARRPWPAPVKNAQSLVVEGQLAP
jgi:hypothetical protein